MGGIFDWGCTVAEWGTETASELRWVGRPGRLDWISFAVRRLVHCSKDGQNCTGDGLPKVDGMRKQDSVKAAVDRRMDVEYYWLSLGESHLYRGQGVYDSFEER